MQSMTASDADPNIPKPGRLIPVPDIPVQPVLSAGTLGGFFGPKAPSVLDSGKALFLTAGRIAIAQALLRMGIREGDRILLPAYHCASMVEPLSAVAAEPVFYRIRDDLSVDLEDVEAKIDDRVRVLVATNYFGFPQDLNRLRAFCDSHGLMLLEDCAHSFFGEYDGRPLGSTGDYAIASLTKFFPVRDGGCLVSARHPVNGVPMRGQGLKPNVSSVLDTIEDGVDYGRLSPIQPLVCAGRFAKRHIRAAMKRNGNGDGDGNGRTPRSNPAQLKSGALGDFDPEWLNIKISVASRFICRFASAERICRRRRSNFLSLLDGFSGLDHCRPVITELPEGTVPYMFPLWVDRLNEVFPILEDAAIPMQRFGQFLWPGVDAEVCQASIRLSRNTIQLPCHQELTDDEVQRMVERVRKIVES